MVAVHTMTALRSERESQIIHDSDRGVTPGANPVLHALHFIRNELIGSNNLSTLRVDMGDIPPGITGNLRHYASGGVEGSEWRDLPATTRRYTNAFVVQDNKILLGMKKRGWGQGKYNGFGGKVDVGEEPLDAAKRELKEEAGIDADLVHAGVFLFLTDGVEWAFHIDIYRADSFTGEVTESEEMKPEWFAASTEVPAASELPPIPFDRMWETDHVWLPLLIARKPFAGRADFTGEKDQSKPCKWRYGLLEEGAGP
ncbi:hypothetical protein NMY22_g12938 [Coprinellus aureogranulatus]|nr:hypothetical protein NMY22_g12938 [Coprinellus aureogranulatus]